MNNTRVDLHIHTDASDGAWSPEKVVAEVKKAGIRVFSITDHETVKNVVSTRRLAAEAGLLFMPGVEMSATVKGQSFHILGYGIDPENEVLQRVLRHNTALMEEVDHDSIKKLIADGFVIDYAEYCSYEHKPERGGWKSLNFLIDQGLCRDVGDFFTRLFTAKRGIRYPDFLPPEDVIGAIKSAGGVPILAHPGSEFHGVSLEETLDYFGVEDIEGVECFHPGHDAAITKRALEWCSRHRLWVTGGSDCHGDFVRTRRLGVPDISLGQIRLGILMEILGF